jgi:hypothetical protein
VYHASVIDQRKSWIWHFAYCIPNEKSLNTCSSLRLKNPEEGIRTVHTDPMRIWGPHKILQIRIQKSGSVPIRVAFFSIRFYLHFAFLKHFLTGLNPRIGNRFRVSFNSFGKNSLDGFDKILNNYCSSWTFTNGTIRGLKDEMQIPTRGSGSAHPPSPRYRKNSLIHYGIKLRIRPWNRTRLSRQAGSRLEFLVVSA